MRSLVSLFVATLLLTSAAVHGDDKTPTKVYYRYYDDKGVKVLDHSIPPKYVRSGYEVLSMSGEVLRVVEPAPAEEDAERVARERKIQADQHTNDALLRRRYSNLNDIEAIKKRSLLELQSNLDILRGNLSSTRAQIENQHVRAAATERSGRTVTSETLKLIADLQAEERDIQLQIKHRELEYQSLSDRFDQDKRRFEELMQEDKP